MTLLGSLNSFRLAVAVGAALLAIAATPASADKFRTIRSFCHPDFCADGRTPSGTLLQDSEHKLYGTTETGGQRDSGVAYRLTENPSTHIFGLKVLYNFCNKNNCEDGGHPIRGRLIVDKNGRLFGVASTGGTTGNGVIYTLTPNPAKTHYTYTVIYNFCDKFTGCEDGSFPIGGLTYKGQPAGTAYDGTSPLYGVTKLGGRHHAGVIFQLTPGTAGRWVPKILYVFCSVEKSCEDGKYPNENLSFDRFGNLWGTTVEGGNDTSSGVAFKLIPTVSGHWAISVAHRFCDEENCTDGKTPNFGTVIDSTGNILGTTVAGGTADADRCPDGCGLFYKLAPSGNLTAAHSFCSEADCTDGGAPAGLMIDTNGNIFGTTNLGGTFGHGTLFEMTKDGAFTTLYNIKCHHKDCRKGVTSTGALVAHPDGRLFGTLISGGHFGDDSGVAFEYTPTEE